VVSLQDIEKMTNTAIENFGHPDTVGRSSIRISGAGFQIFFIYTALKGGQKPC